jgi:hypothetical protein
MRVLVLFATLLCVGEGAVADQIPFKILDVGWLQQSSYGEGVEFIYQFDSKPGDGEEAIKAFALSECNRVAPKYVPKVLEKLGKAKPDFISMNFRFGGMIGTYEKFFANYDDGLCTWDK